MLAELRLALGFLTTLPIPQPRFDARQFSRAGRWYPLCGLVIGGLLALLYALLSQLFAPLIAAALTVAAWAALTGGLHLDGLADCADALLPPVTRPRRLEILRDPHVGAFGVVALVLALMLKVSAVATAVDPIAALLLAPLWARWTLLPAARRPLARQDGLGASFAAGLTPSLLGQALATALIATAAVVLWRGFAWQSGLAIAAAHAITGGVVLLAQRRLGGVTGDVLGLTVESGEIVILLIFALQ